MDKNVSELLDVEAPTVIADTGYYNGTEIKNCIDDGMSVYIKRQKQIIQLKIMNSGKKNSFTIRNRMHTYVRQATSYSFLKTHQKTEQNIKNINARTVILASIKKHALLLQVVVRYNVGSMKIFWRQFIKTHGI